ncbi:hypothetical protein Ct9H90mP12_0070 [bacterium]|nr:MAG: hypothetical protein Ct9H90mP12_0070 [bacterium]
MEIRISLQPGLRADKILWYENDGSERVPFLGFSAKHRRNLNGALGLDQ